MNRPIGSHQKKNITGKRTSDRKSLDEFEEDPLMAVLDEMDEKESNSLKKFQGSNTMSSPGLELQQSKIPNPLNRI